jgi:tRNA-dihydrouridine synthase B
MKSLKIGNVVLKNRLFLSPMVDVTDVAYRMLCRKEGAGMAYTEMINISAILNENKKTLGMLKTVLEDKPVGLQVTGRNVDEFKKLSELDIVRNFDLVDLNCGCPSSRITGNQSGSYLLQDPEKIGKMIRVLKDKDLIVTAKIRLGFKKNEVMKISNEIEKAGADLLTIHARTAVQRNRDKPDWDEIAKVKREVGIPVVGNGGIKNGNDVEKMLDICDGVMIATSAIGNPFVFREIQRYLKTGKEKEVMKEEKIKSYGDYIKLAEKYDVLEIGRVKFLGGWFLRGFDGAAKARGELMEMKDLEIINNFIKKL